MRNIRSFFNRRVLVRAASVTLPLAALTALPACDLLNQAKASVENAAQLPIDVQQSTKVTLDVGALIGALAGQTVPPGPDLTQDLTTPPAPIDLNKEQPELAKYASGHIKTVEINKIAVTPTTNTLTGDLPALDLYFGGTTAKSYADGIKVATIPSIKAGSTTAIDAIIDTAKMSEAGTKYLSTLAFSQMMAGKLVIKAGEKVPTGKIDLKLDLGVHAVVTAL